MALDDQRDVALDLFARFLIGDQPALCLIDTGSPGTTISTRFMAPLGVDPASSDVKKQERRAVESGATITRYWTDVPQVSLAEAPQVALLHPRVSFADIIYDCVVSGFLARPRAHARYRAQADDRALMGEGAAGN